MNNDPRLNNIVAAQPYPLLFATISGARGEVRNSKFEVRSLSRLGLRFARGACVAAPRSVKQDEWRAELVVMSEGNVYLCVWAKRGARLTLALKDDPKIKVSAPELDEAEEKMWELLCEKFGDGEAVLQYVTPPPVAATEFAARYGRPHLVIVSGNDSMGGLLNEKEVHPKGYCRDCRDPLVTTKVTPEYDYVPPSDGAVGGFFSADFLSLLTKKEKEGLQLVPVVGPKRARKSFFKLTGAAVADFVGVPGFEGLCLDRCRRCKRALTLMYLRNNKLYRFLALNDLPTPPPAVFVVGREGNISLCVTRERFSQLLGKPGARNITSSRVWVVPDERFIRSIDENNSPKALRWEASRGFFPELT